MSGVIALSAAGRLSVIHTAPLRTSATTLCSDMAFFDISRTSNMYLTFKSTDNLLSKTIGQPIKFASAGGVHPRQNRHVAA
jgi:hypothetical protein